MCARRNVLVTLTMFTCLLSSCAGPANKAPTAVVSAPVEEAQERSSEASGPRLKDQSAEAKNVSQAHRVSEANLLSDIKEIAQRADGTFEDAWFCERNPRVLKTDYTRVSPEEKARFAIEYQKMLEAKGQNLARDIGTYVPYEERSAFALKWWQNSEYKSSFDKENTKKKIQWIYESLLDAGELFWRAYELRQKEQINSAAVAAHYKEEDMVSNYMENEKTPGSFSDQYARWTERNTAAGNK